MAHEWWKQYTKEEVQEAEWDMDPEVVDEVWEMLCDQYGREQMNKYLEIQEKQSGNRTDQQDTASKRYLG